MATEAHGRKSYSLCLTCRGKPVSVFQPAVFCIDVLSGTPKQENDLYWLNIFVCEDMQKNSNGHGNTRNTSFCL